MKISMLKLMSGVAMTVCTASQAFAFLTINVGGKKIQPFSDQGQSASASSQEFIQVGSRVQCNWKGQGRLYPGSVTRMKGNSVYIKYDDGDQEDTVASRCKVIAGSRPAVQPSQMAAGDAKQKEGAAVTGGAESEARSVGETDKSAPQQAQPASMPANELLASINYTPGSKPTKEQAIRLILECVRAEASLPSGSRDKPEVCTISSEARKVMKADDATRAELRVAEADAIMDVRSSYSTDAIWLYKSALSEYYEKQIPNDKITGAIRSKLGNAESVSGARNLQNMIQRANKINNAALRECVQSLGSVAPTFSNEPVNEAFANLDRLNQVWLSRCGKFDDRYVQWGSVAWEIRDSLAIPRCRRLATQVPLDEVQERAFVPKFVSHCDGLLEDGLQNSMETLAKSQESNLVTRANSGDSRAALTLGLRGLSDALGYPIGLTHKERNLLRFKARPPRDATFKANLDKGFKWLALADKGRQSLAPIGLALAHLMSDGLNQGGRSAFNWLKKSADAADPIGMYMLGWAYDHSIGVSGNARLSNQWYSRGNQAGYRGNAYTGNEEWVLERLHEYTPQTQAAKQQAIQEGFNAAESMSKESQQRRDSSCKERCRSACSRGQYEQTCIDCTRSCQVSY